jgi:hypothetical protein
VAENYPFTTTLSIEEFTDVFTEILDDRSDQVFMQLANQSLEGKVDLYESLSSIVPSSHHPRSSFAARSSRRSYGSCSRCSISISLARSRRKNSS